MSVIEKSIQDGKIGTPEFLGLVRDRIIATYDAKAAATANAAAAHKKALDDAKNNVTPAAKPADKPAEPATKPAEKPAAPAKTM